MQRPWHTRIVLGCWSARYFPLCATHLPSFPITLICFDVGYARRFLSVPNVSFNIKQKVIMGPLGRGFLDDARAANRSVYVWTVNEPSLMRWSIAHAVDGVITDNPVLFRQICAEYGGHTDSDRLDQVGKVQVPWKIWLEVLIISFWVVLFGWFFRWRYLPAPERVRFDHR